MKKESEELNYLECSKEPENPTIPLVISLIVVFFFWNRHYYAGLFQGNMHLITTLKNAYNAYS